ncbi:hypothetical protein EW026_g7832 [Hermanssonia centrifuga]|uniref:Uncharacterized protein n=1 Tax=Hermanssonia centrifuga TaxID=98765 RepID=A0A4S4K6H4_9APHY|nr:hypothetical protein EW026_g7832 [Hermanssonia centrifuga]
MSASPTITSAKPQLDAKIAAKLQGPHGGIDMAPSVPQLLAEPIQGDATPPANTRNLKIGLTAWFAAYTPIFIHTSRFIGCILLGCILLAMLSAFRAMTITFVGFVLLACYDYFTVGLPGFFVIIELYFLHWQTAMLGASLIGLACGPLAVLGVTFCKRARGKMDEASKAERMKMKRDSISSVVNSGWLFVLLDVVLGALMYPAESFASARYFEEESLFMAALALVMCLARLGLKAGGGFGLA